MKPPFAPVLGVLAVCASVLVTTAHAQHSQGAHEHGVAHLSVAIEGGEVLIELGTPLDNLVGFEHAPTTDAQRSAVADAGAKLRRGEALFLLPDAAGCVLAETSMDSPWQLEAVQGDGHAHAHGDHDHDHDHDHRAETQDGHAEMLASYRFECARPAALDALDVRLFDAFPRLRELRAVRAAAGGQGAAVLKPGAAVLPL